MALESQFEDAMRYGEKHTTEEVEKRQAAEFEGARDDEGNGRGYYESDAGGEVPFYVPRD